MHVLIRRSSGITNNCVLFSKTYLNQLKVQRFVHNLTGKKVFACAEEAIRDLKPNMTVLCGGTWFGSQLCVVLREHFE